MTQKSAYDEKCHKMYNKISQNVTKFHVSKL